MIILKCQHLQKPGLPEDAQGRGGSLSPSWALHTEVWSMPHSQTFCARSSPSTYTALARSITQPQTQGSCLSAWGDLRTSGLRSRKGLHRTVCCLFHRPFPLPGHSTNPILFLAHSLCRSVCASSGECISRLPSKGNFFTGLSLISHVPVTLPGWSDGDSPPGQVPQRFSGLVCHSPSCHSKDTRWPGSLLPATPRTQLAFHVLKARTLAELQAKQRD